MRHVGRDRGAADALGLVLLAPAMIGLAVLVLYLGRGVDARAQVRSAAAAGAQAAALERSQFGAQRAARAVVDAMLVDEDACPDPQVSTIFPAEPDVSLGVSYGEVTVTVRCETSNRGLEFVRDDDREAPFEVTATARVDFFRARAGS